MVVKTYRGLLADDGQDRIRLSTIKGKVGYRIVKFKVITETPTTVSAESVVQIWKDKQTSAVATIDFSDGSLLAVGMWTSNDDTATQSEDMTVIFDNQIINQDIFITHQNSAGSASCNYYIELEVIPLSDMAAEYTTLKDIRTQLTLS